MVEVIFYHSLFFTMPKTAPADRASCVGSPASSQQTASMAGERPTAYSVYPGKVVRIDPVTRKMSVVILNNYQIDNCTYMSDSLAALLGFAQSSLPVPGSQAMVVYTPKQSYVIGGIGAKTVTNPKAFTVPAAGDIEFETINDPAFGVRRGKQNKMLSPGYIPGKDILPGESEYTNNMGIWLRLLMNMAQLSAGELAKVEVGLVNDMVRIVDNYFAHHNVGGDKLIWSAGGKCVEEDHFTSQGFEAEGKLDEHEALIESNSHVVNPGKLEDPTNETGRWRKSSYIGFLGDMIHTWISDPTEALSNYAEGASRAGKYRCWVGSDGMLMVQATGGVFIQVYPSVVIPEVKHNWNDPNFSVPEAFSNLNKKFLKMWGKGTDGWRDMTVACWQMSAWARYITLWHSLARWNGLVESGYCNIQDEKSSPKAEPTAKEKDKEEVNPECKEMYTGSALLSIDPSGSISLVASGSSQYPGTTSVTLNRGNVQIAAAGNMELQCGGTLSISAKHISMKAAKNIEIAAIAGGLWLKARTSWNALCELGRMWLKSDMKPGVKPPEIENLNTPVPANACNYAIYLDAAEGRAAIHGKKEVTVTTSARNAPIHIETQRRGSPVNLYSKERIDMAAGKMICAHAENAIGLSSTSILLDCLSSKIANIVYINPASIECNGFIRAKLVASKSGYLGNSQYVGVGKKHMDPEVFIDEANERTYAKLKITTLEADNRAYTGTVKEVYDGSQTWSFLYWNDAATRAADITEWKTYKMSPVDASFYETTQPLNYNPDSTLTEITPEDCLLLTHSSTTESTATWPGYDSYKWSYFPGDPVPPPLIGAADVEDGNPERGGADKMSPSRFNFCVQRDGII